MIKKIVVYHPSSFGGTYDYALHLLPSLVATGLEVELIMPVNAAFNGPEVRKILLTDQVEGSTLVKRLHFLWRTLVNPLKLWWHVCRSKDTLVLFNDFEQLSAPIWVPLFKAFKPQGQVLAVELHDADRDAYPPSLAYSQLTMRLMMEAMDIGIYHEVLVDKPYYKASKTRYISVPFGEYRIDPPSEETVKALKSAKEGGYILAGMLGNIRPEKNYHLAIDALASVPNLKLVIAGRAANSGVDLNDYRRQAEALGVADRIVWMDRFLSEAEMSAVIATSDMILLAYSATFKSQSAIFASLVPFRSNLVASEGENALTKAVATYNLGEFVVPDDGPSLVDGIRRAMQHVNTIRPGWAQYAADYSWAENVKRIMDAVQEVEQR